MIDRAVRPIGLHAARAYQRKSLHVAFPSLRLERPVVTIRRRVRICGIGRQVRYVKKRKRVVCSTACLADIVAEALRITHGHRHHVWRRIAT